MGASVLASWRRQLLLRVHPDLFSEARHARERALNERSLQAFHALFALAFPRPRTPASSPPTGDDPTRPLLTFHFFMRRVLNPPASPGGGGGDGGLAGPPLCGHTAAGTLHGDAGQREDLEEVQSEFNPSPDVRRHPDRLRRAAEDCMMDLFIKARIIAPRPSAPTPVRVTAHSWRDEPRRDVDPRLTASAVALAGTAYP